MLESTTAATKQAMTADEPPEVGQGKTGTGSRYPMPRLRSETHAVSLSQSRIGSIPQELVLLEQLVKLARSEIVIRSIEAKHIEELLATIVEIDGP